MYDIVNSIGIFFTFVKLTIRFIVSDFYTTFMEKKISKKHQCKFSVINNL